MDMDCVKLFYFGWKAWYHAQFRLACGTQANTRREQENLSATRLLTEGSQVQVTTFAPLRVQVYDAA